ncbi:MULTISPECIES: hypothetical protein [Exiguobacterium]|uniref:Uncharacterized protein n=1 Tax=Exiguobacterium antarcticum TaxID=132920 RepID=A0ABT6R172_9BACL|nr:MULTISPECIES: hypothetical protein [Exiguobacterium]AFS71789.1 Hypothetical protein Eab7_2704 [Exiguobacterium antarcticum B7]MCT4779553.1 hypothetical protein [Exiguobacterium soli]MDI3234696.1 hypothetical protein [Exiguobacterium antarcticum]
MSFQKSLQRLVKNNVAFELAIEQLYTPTGYYLCKHTLIDQYPDLLPTEQVMLLQKIAEQIERSTRLEETITKQNWIQIHQQLSNDL